MQQIGQEDPQITSRMLWAFVAIGAMLALWAYLFPPAPPAKAPPAPAEVGKAAKAPRAAPAPPEAGTTLAPPAEGAAALSAGAEEFVTLENEDLRLVLSNRGAVLRQAILKRYRDPAGHADDLVSPLSAALGRYPLELITDDSAWNKKANAAMFHVERREGGKAREAVFTFSDGQGFLVRKALSLPPSGYRIDFELAATRGGSPVDPVPVAWGPGFASLSARQAKNTYYQQEYAALSEGGSFKKVGKEKKASSSRYGEKAPLEWAAIANNYFAAVFVPEKPAPWVRVGAVALSPEQKKLYPAETALDLVVALPGRGSLHLLPKEWSRLGEMGGLYPRLQDWGWLTPICAVLLWGMRQLFTFSRNYGLAIILLTFVIRLLFLPLTQRSMVKMKEMGEGMKRLKPQIDRIKAKYKKEKGMESRSKMNEEMMALYKREGINPLTGMGGCLPLLLQMPIFFALFTMLPRAIELRGAPFFGWISDLSTFDPYYITPILMGVSMVVSTVMTSTQLEGPQKAMMWMMPVMFTWFCLWAPAGLTLYWLVNNLLTMAQQGLINRQVERKKEEAAKGRKSTPKGISKSSRD